MLIRESELGLGLIGLGRMTEFAAMTVWADAQACALTAGTGGTLRDVVDTSGARLYPGYFWTHVAVPPNRMFERHQVWDRIAVGVDVRVLGPILDSTYVLGTPAELAMPAAERPVLPAMRGAAMFFVEGRAGEPQPASPKKGTVAELQKLEKAPAALAAFKDVRLRGVVDVEFTGRIRLAAPIEYPIVAGRDAAVGHSLVFAQFVRLFDAAECALLSELRPPAPAELIEQLAVLDREVFYFDNCGPGSVAVIDATATIERCAPDLIGTPDQISAAIVKLALTAHERNSGRMLAVSSVRKLLVVPRTRPAMLHAAERLCRQCCEVTP